MSSYSDHAERWNYMQELLEDGSKNKSLKQKRKYISRCDCDERYEHYYRVEIRVGDVRCKKHFSDKKCGGKVSALLAAVGWRDKKIKEFGLVHQKGLVCQPFRKDKKGIWQRTKTIKGREYEFMVAGWREPVNGKQVSKVKEYSVNKYGLKKATRLAKKYREEKLKELYG